MKKLVVILGPTAAGKSVLAVKLAKRFSGEIISADSRQIYKGLDIGSGKITKKEMEGIPHHLLGIASPRKRFTVMQYISRAIDAMTSITQQGKLPILVGGSPLYIYAVVDGWVIPEVKPNAKIRKQLEKFTIGQLFKKLQKLDPQRAQTIEHKNPRRLIRALEIVMTTQKPVPKFEKRPLPYPVLFLGIKKSPAVLQQNIRRRFLSMLRRGFLNEVKTLHGNKLSWYAIENFGLEYRQASQYLQGKISRQEMIDSAVRATQDLARHQMVWFKKDHRIHWIGHSHQAEIAIEDFLS